MVGFYDVKAETLSRECGLCLSRIISLLLSVRKEILRGLLSLSAPLNCNNQGLCQGTHSTSKTFVFNNH